MVPDNVPNDERLRRHLIRAAGLHDDGLIRATANEIRQEVAKLAAVTVATRQDDREALVQLEALLEGLADAPLDILQEACRQYARVDGTRYFPRSVGELRAFLSPALTLRQRRASRLRMTADVLQARHDETLRRKRENLQWTAEKVADANVDFQTAGARGRLVYVGDGRARWADGSEAMREG